MKTRIFRFALLSGVSAVLLSFGVQQGRAGLYAYNAYAIVNPGSGNTYYDIDVQTANPDFSGSTFTINFGQALKLGGQVTSDAGNGAPAANGPDWAQLAYKIDGSSWQYLGLPYSTDYGTSGWKVTFEQANTSGMADIGSGLSYGSHSLEIYFQTHDNTQPADAWVNAGGANYIATINVVPEPTNLALLTMLGLAGAVEGRKLLRRSRAKAP